MEAAQSKELDGQLCCAAYGQVGKRFAQHTGEFEAVTRKASDEMDVFVLGMSIDEKMLVGRHGVEANATPLHGPTHAGQVLRQKLFDAGEVRWL